MMICIMQVVIVAFAAVVLGVGILATNPEESAHLVPESKVLAEKSEKTTVPPLVIPTEEPVSNEMNDYRYPGSEVKTSSSNKVELQTTDHSNEVTDWYRNLIKSQGFSITSSVKTATNGVVNNKLVGSDNNVTINISVTQNGDSATTIVVER